MSPTEHSRLNLESLPLALVQGLNRAALGTTELPPDSHLLVSKLLRCPSPALALKVEVDISPLFISHQMAWLHPHVLWAASCLLRMPRWNTLARPPSPGAFGSLVPSCPPRTRLTPWDLRQLLRRDPTFLPETALRLQCFPSSGISDWHVSHPSRGTQVSPTRAFAP